MNSLEKNQNNNKPLVFAHVGDLDINKAKEQNYIDFLSIVSQIETECSKQLDFVFYPAILPITRN